MAIRGAWLATRVSLWLVPRGSCTPIWTAPPSPSRFGHPMAASTRPDTVQHSLGTVLHYSHRQFDTACPLTPCHGRDVSDAYLNALRVCVGRADAGRVGPFAASGAAAF
eukprot:5300008-Pyramimonas_sp.AAC.1